MSYHDDPQRAIGYQREPANPNASTEPIDAFVICPKCRGKGYGNAPDYLPCETCEGAGEIEG